MNHITHVNVIQAEPGVSAPVARSNWKPHLVLPVLTASVLKRVTKILFYFRVIFQCLGFWNKTNTPRSFSFEASYARAYSFPKRTLFDTFWKNSTSHKYEYIKVTEMPYYVKNNVKIQNKNYKFVSSSTCWEYKIKIVNFNKKNLLISSFFEWQKVIISIQRTRGEKICTQHNKKD